MVKKSVATGEMDSAEEWRIEQDLRTLTDAKEIQADPKRMAKVQAMARKKLETVAAVIDTTVKK